MVGVAPKFSCVVARCKPWGKRESAQIARAMGIHSLPIPSIVLPRVPTGQVGGPCVPPSHCGSMDVG